jgi:hypothetical protein
MGWEGDRTASVWRIQTAARRYCTIGSVAAQPETNGGRQRGFASWLMTLRHVCAQPCDGHVSMARTVASIVRGRWRPETRDQIQTEGHRPETAVVTNSGAAVAVEDLQPARRVQSGNPVSYYGVRWARRALDQLASQHGRSALESHTSMQATRRVELG